MPRPLALDGYIAERIFNQPLLLEPGKARIIAQVLERRFNMKGLENISPPMPMPNPMPMDDPDEEEEFTEGIEIISMVGTLVQRGGFCDAESGLLSYSALREQISKAAGDPAVRVIVLDISSGGGEADGNFELGRYIRQVNDEIKPVIAIANGYAYSGAYSLGCAAGKFFMIETGGVGSVGVITQHIDYSKQNEMMGIKVTNITAGEKKDQLSSDFPLSDEAENMLQRKVNITYDIFVNHVASMRGISASVIENTEGALLFGNDAVTVGFVDGIMGYDELISSLTTANFPSGLISTQQRINEMFKKNEKPADDPKNKVETDPEKKPEVTAPAAEPEKKVETAPANPAPEAPAQTEDVAERAAVITEMCNASGFSAKAPAYIRSARTVEEIRTEVDNHSQIKNACKLAGKPDRAEGFISSGKSLKQVQDELIGEMSKKQADISNLPSPEQGKEDVTVAGNAIQADIDRRRNDKQKATGKGEGK